MNNLNVDPKRRHLKDGERHSKDCSGIIRENHDNFECLGCSYVDWDIDKPKTGLFVRACFDGVWGDYDIAELDKGSLLEYLYSKSHAVAISAIFVLLGHPR